MGIVSGWYEGEEGAVDILIDDDVTTLEDVAQALLLKYGVDCVGVDMELEGTLDDGKEISDQMGLLFEELDFLT